MFWLFFSLGVLLILSLPFLRLFFKRLVLRAKLTAAVEAAGGRLIPARPFWLFGGRRGRTCDFYMETPDTVYAVKLFTVLFKTTNLYFSENGALGSESASVRAEHYIPAFGRWGTVLSLPIAGKTKPLPVYDFTSGLPADAENKALYCALLVHPACFEIYRHTGVRETELMYAGDAIGELHVQSLSALIKELRRASGGDPEKKSAR